MPYVFSMTARMATIAACCVLLLCVLLFLLGVEIGARYAAPAAAPGASGVITRSVTSEHVPMPAGSDAAASAVPASNAS
jgi:hypothetical protein